MLHKNRAQKLAEESRGTMGFAATRLRCIREAPRCIPCFAVGAPPATCCCLFLWISGTRQQSRHVRSAAQVPRARRVRLLLRRPQAEVGGRSDQPEGAVALVRANRGAGALVGTGAATPGAAKGSVRTILGPNLLLSPFLAQICS